MQLNFKRKTATAAQEAAGGAPGAAQSKSIGKLGNEIQADIEALGAKFVRLVAECSQLPASCDDLKVQTLSRHKLHGLLQIELARADVQPHHGITDSTLHGRPTLGELVQEAARAVEQRLN